MEAEYVEQAGNELRQHCETASRDSHASMKCVRALGPESKNFCELSRTYLKQVGESRAPRQVTPHFAPIPALHACWKGGASKSQIERGTGIVREGSRGNIAQDIERMEYLDGVRGWAALVVVLHHLALTFEPLWLKTGEVAPSLGPLSFLVDGGLAVCIFFILSGIVLAAATDGALRRLSGPTFVGLIAKRWLRLMLPILAVAVVAWVMLRANFNLAPMAAIFTGSTWAMGFYPRWYDPTLPRVLWEAAYGAFAGAETPFHNPVLWTIRVEFPGSVLTFAICLLARSSRARLVLAALAALALLQMPFWILNDCALFPVGVAMWEVLKRRETIPWGRTADLCGLALVALGLVILPVLDHFFSTAALRRDMTTVADDVGLMNLNPWAVRAMLIIVGVCLSPTAMGFLGNSLSRFLGRISFAVYLSHSLILVSLGAFTYVMLLHPLGRIGSMAAATFGVLTASIALGWGLHRWVERPAILIAGRAGALVDRMWRRLSVGDG